MTPRNRTILEIATSTSRPHVGMTPEQVRRQLKRQLEPLESDMQKALIELLLGKIGKEGRQLGGGLTLRYPELMLIYAINPNKGGQNSKAARGLAKAMGLAPDVPDLCLPVPRGPFHGLYLEGKRGRQGRLSDGQKGYIQCLRELGYCVAVWKSAEEGFRAVTWYLKLDAPRRDDHLWQYLHTRLEEAMEGNP